MKKVRGMQAALLASRPILEIDTEFIVVVILRIGIVLSNIQPLHSGETDITPETLKTID